MGRAPLLCPPTSDIKLVPQFGLPRQSPLRAHKRPFRRYRQSRKYEVTSARVQAAKRKLLKSIAFEDLGARVDAPGVPHDQLPVLSLQERSSDLTRPDDEVPQAIKLLNDDVHLSVPRRTCIPASTYLSRQSCDSLLGAVILITDFGTQLAPAVERRLLSLITLPEREVVSCLCVPLESPRV